jgi:hypothetical protein
MLEVVQRHQRTIDDLVGRLVVQPRDHGHAAAIVFESRVVEAVGLRRLVAHVHGTLPWSAARGARERAGSVADRPAER